MMFYILDEFMGGRFTFAENIFGVILAWMSAGYGAEDTYKMGIFSSYLRKRLVRRGGMKYRSGAVRYLKVLFGYSSIGSGLLCPSASD